MIKFSIELTIWGPYDCWRSFPAFAHFRPPQLLPGDISGLSSCCRCRRHFLLFGDLPGSSRPTKQLSRPTKRSAWTTTLPSGSTQ